jgi:hypothetical protein
MIALVYIDRIWLVVGPAYIRLSTVITFFAVFVFVAWRFRASPKTALYNGVIAWLATLSLYEVLFNITGGFPPTDMLPFWGVAILVGSMILGLLQAKKHFTPSRLPLALLLAFALDWLVWIAVGFPFNLPTSQPLNLLGEALNASTKMLLPFGYATGLRERR